MNSDAVVVKIEPTDDYDAGTSVTVSPTVLQNGIREKNDISPESDKGGDNTFPDTRNFTCLLCDVVCSSREDLRKHLKLLHTSKTYSAMSNTGYLNTVSPESSSRVFSGYVNYRYTCSTCGAKFKSFRTYLTHNMSHRSENGLQHLDEMRMAALFGTGKQYMQEYMESDESMSGTFTCTECDTVFVQRDAYAMHMMMRAMNETCKTSALSFDEGSHVNNNEKTKPQNSPEVKENGVTNHVDGETNHQRCLEDITAQVDQDEYLKSVLDKVCVSDASKGDLGDYNLDDRKSCLFCKENFMDQDSLAMHVMSDHAEEMTSAGTNSRNNVRNSNTAEYMTWMTMATRPLALSCICKYCNETFMSRDSLALHVLSHAHLEERLSEQARNVYKRKFDVADSKSAMLGTKIPRYFPPAVTDDVSVRIKPSTSRTVVTLFCHECNIRFYAESEFDWHMRRHNEGKVTSYAEPLCLTKEKPKEVEEKPDMEEGVNTNDAKNNKPRRNSFSCDLSVGMINGDTLPRRPVSVGDCSRETLKHLNKTCNDKNGDGMDEGSKRVTKDSVLQTINALSSSEQRIIYSVFGKDLSLKVSKSEDSPDMRTTLSPKQGTEVENNDNSLTQSNGKIDDTHELNLKNEDGIVTSNYKNGDQDSRQKLLSTEKDAPMCKYCEILFFNKAIYYLHMGLHNVNNPWQCNVCGKLCSNAVDFAAHVIHM